MYIFDYLTENVPKGVRPAFELESDAHQAKFLQQIMVRCWETYPSKRPSFTEVVKSLEFLASSS